MSCGGNSSIDVLSHDHSGTEQERINVVRKDSVDRVYSVEIGQFSFSLTRSLQAEGKEEREVDV